MKKLYIFMILMLFSTLAFSQSAAIGPSAAGSLSVYNYTQCPQYFAVIGYQYCACATPGGSHLVTTTLKIDAANSPTYPAFKDYSSFELFGETVPIIEARVRDGLYCGSSGPVGQPCTGLPSSYIYKATGENCKYCGITEATWIPAPACGDPAKLIFENP